MYGTNALLHQECGSSSVAFKRELMLDVCAFFLAFTCVCANVSLVNII